MNRKAVIIWKKNGGPRTVAAYTWKIHKIPVAAFREEFSHEYTFVDLRDGSMIRNTKCYTLKAAEKELRQNVPGPMFPEHLDITKDRLERLQVIDKYKREGGQ